MAECHVVDDPRQLEVHRLDDVGDAHWRNQLVRPVAVTPFRGHLVGEDVQHRQDASGVHS